MSVSGGECLVLWFNFLMIRQTIGCRLIEMPQNTGRVCKVLRAPWTTWHRVGESDTELRESQQLPAVALIFWSHACAAPSQLSTTQRSFSVLVQWLVLVCSDPYFMLLCSWSLTSIIHRDGLTRSDQLESGTVVFEFHCRLIDAKFGRRCLLYCHLKRQEISSTQPK
jgi:hypothetical protein